MPAESIANTGFEIHRNAHTIKLSRTLDATPAEVFDAWTKPEDVRCWWDAAGGALTLCEIDLRVGGAFKFVTMSHPDMPFAGLYHEIIRPERLVFGAMGATGRVILQDVSGKTHMTVEIACNSADHLEKFLQMGVAAGTSKTLDNLVAYLHR